MRVRARVRVTCYGVVTIVVDELSSSVSRLILSAIVGSIKVAEAAGVPFGVNCI